MTDAELVRAAREDDPDAWRVLCERYLPHVWRCAYNATSDRHAAEDLTSETMLALLKNIKRLNYQDPKVGAWLRSVVRNKVADLYRHTYRRRRRLDDLMQTRLQADPLPEPSDELERRELRFTVQSLLGQMSETQRMLLEWKYGDNLSVRDIASRINKSEKGVEAALYRARQEFRRLFELAEKAPIVPIDVASQSSEVSSL